MEWVFHAPWLQLTNRTGCRHKCTVRSFALAERSVENITWRRNYSAAFFLDVKTSAYETELEFWVFDLGDTMTGIGGVLSLFLGYSILGTLWKMFQLVEKAVVRHLTRSTQFKLRTAANIFQVQ